MVTEDGTKSRNNRQGSRTVEELTRGWDSLGGRCRVGWYFGSWGGWTTLGGPEGHWSSHVTCNIGY